MTPAVDAAAIAHDLMAACAQRQMVPAPPTTTVPGFDLVAAYDVEAELVRLRRAGGHTTVGRKVGYANKAVWRALKLETLVWAHMYDDTVRYASTDAAALDIGRMFAPKIEPEIVFKLGAPVPAAADASQVLDAVEWVALGFEIIDCPFADWKFQMRISLPRSGCMRRWSSATRARSIRHRFQRSPSNSHASRCDCRKTERSWRRAPAGTRCAVRRSAWASWRQRLRVSPQRSRSRLVSS